MNSVEAKFLSIDGEKRAVAAFQRQDYCTVKDLLVKALKEVQLLGQLPQWVIDLVDALATIYCMERRYDQAELLYANTLIAREKILGFNHPDVIDNLQKLAIIIRERHGDNVATKTIAFRARYLAIQSPASI